MKKIFIFGIIMLLAFSSFVLAGERDPPHQFYGKVITNGVMAEDNLFVIAKIGDSEFTTTTSDGKYGLNPNIFYVLDDASGREGETITFYVKDKNDVYQQSGPSAFFMNGMSTYLDISVTGDFNTDTTPTTTSSGSGGGSGGSGRGSTQVTNTTEDSNVTELVDDSDCEPDWSCSEWEDCIAESQKRTCVDDNACDSNNTVSIEQRECEILSLEESLKQEEKGKKGAFGWITGAVIGGGAASYAGAAFVVLIIALALYLNFKKKK